MDDKFRLVFASREDTPAADAYFAANAIGCDRLRDAVRIGSEMNIVWSVPFIAHRFAVLDPALIDLLYRELFSRPSSGSKPDILG